MCKAPSTSVQRFLLSPDNCFGVRILVKILLKLLPWEWIQLFDSGNGSILVSIVGTVLVQSGVYLTRAEDDAINVGVVIDGLSVFRIWNDPLELRLARELID